MRLVNCSTTLPPPPQSGDAAGELLDNAPPPPHSGDAAGELLDNAPPPHSGDAAGELLDNAPPPHSGDAAGELLDNAPPPPQSGDAAGELLDNAPETRPVLPDDRTHQQAARHVQRVVGGSTGGGRHTRQRRDARHDRARLGRRRRVRDAGADLTTRGHGQG